jgi:hypothetical protein
VIGTQWGDGVTEMVFFEGAAHTNMHKFYARKNQGRIWAMQGHGQVLPQCDCIAKIAAGE